MKYSAGLIVCGWVLLASANVYPACEDVEGENTEPVVVGFKMIHCAGNKDRRCASLSVRMSAESYDLLGQPETVKWSYRVNDIKVCKFPYGSTFPVCSIHEADRTVMADFVYDQENNEYFLIKRGAAFFRGIGFRLKSVCLLKGALNSGDYTESCANVSLVANESGKDYVTRDVDFSPLVRGDAEPEMEMTYISVFIPFLLYPALPDQSTDMSYEFVNFPGFER
nr:hypothetical protein [Endozoicomonas sp.]